jgi:hypothetical protein
MSVDMAGFGDPVLSATSMDMSKTTPGPVWNCVAHSIFVGTVIMDRVEDAVADLDTGVSDTDRVPEGLLGLDFEVLAVMLPPFTAVETLVVGVWEGVVDPTPGTIEGTGNGVASSGNTDSLHGSVAFPTVMFEHPYWEQVAAQVVVACTRVKLVYPEPVHPVVRTRKVEGVVGTFAASTVSARLGSMPP